MKSFQALKPFDHLETDFVPGPLGPHPRRAVTSIGLIGPNQPEPGEPVLEDRQEGVSALALLHVGARDDHCQQAPQGVDEAMPRAPFALCVPVKAAAPPLSVVLTDWLSMIPALGWRCFPAATRTSPRSRSCIPCQVPSGGHWRK